MLHNLTGWHLVVIVAVIVLLFGATKLPALAKGLGESMRIFKQEIAPTTAPLSTEPQGNSTVEPADLDTRSQMKQAR